MRISSKKIPRIDNGNDDDDDSSKLKYSEENTETFPETCTEAQSPAKGESDDAYIMLLPNAEPEEKPKVTTNFPFKTYLILITKSLWFQISE